MQNNFQVGHTFLVPHTVRLLVFFLQVPLSKLTFFEVFLNFEGTCNFVQHKITQYTLTLALVNRQR